MRRLEDAGLHELDHAALAVAFQLVRPEGDGFILPQACIRRKACRRCTECSGSECAPAGERCSFRSRNYLRTGRPLNRGSVDVQSPNHQLCDRRRGSGKPKGSRPANCIQPERAKPFYRGAGICIARSRGARPRCSPLLMARVTAEAARIALLAKLTRIPS